MQGSIKYLCRSSLQLVSVACLPIFKWKKGFLSFPGVPVYVKCSCSLVRGHCGITQGAEQPHSPPALQRNLAANVLCPRAESGNLKLDYLGCWWSKARLPVLWADFMLVLYMEYSNNLLENSLQFSKCELMNLLFSWPLPHKLSWS